MSAAPPSLPDMDPELEVLASRLRARMFGIESEPRRLGRYVLVRTLGAGAQGTVWAAYDEALDRRVAIKIVHRRGTDEAADKARKRLLREARSLARIEHPGVVPVYEVDECEAGVFVVMRFLRGRTLDRWVAEERPDWRGVVMLYRQLADGLEAAHRAGVVHRDFKPSNVIVDADGRPWLVDFGLARRTTSNDAPSEVTSSVEARLRDQSASHLTDGGVAIGTPLYWAPEMARGGEATPASDQFSFCVALYSALYDDHPFEGSNVIGKAAAMIMDQVRPVPLDSPVPAELGAALVQGLRADPEARHADMRSLATALDAALQGGPSRGRTAPAAASRSLALPVAVGAVVLVAALVLVLVLVLVLAGP